MQQRVFSKSWRRLRTLMFAVIATIGIVGLPGVASAIAPALMLSPPPTPTTPVVSSVTATPNSTNPLNVDVTATVVSNGGQSPIQDRGFVYSLTSYNADPQIPPVADTGLIEVHVPGTIGKMTRTLPPPANFLTPGANYSVNAFAKNPLGYAYSSPAETFTAPCPLITLAPLPNSSLGANYNAYVYPSGGSGTGYDYLVDPLLLPPGMTFYPSVGLLSGAPTAKGIYDFAIKVLDLGWNCSNTWNYSITIDAIDVGPRQLTFASEAVGVTSPAQDITVINHNTLSSIPLGSLIPSTGEFAVSTEDPNAVIPGTPCQEPLPAAPFSDQYSYCTIHVTYTPSAASVQTGTLPVGSFVISLQGAGTASAQPQVYVSDYNSATVSVIDPATNLVRTTVFVGSNPETLTALMPPGVPPGLGKVYVPNNGDSTVSVISTIDYSVLATITVGIQPTAAAPTPKGHEVWVAGVNDVSVINTATDSVVFTFSDCVDNAQGVVANPATTEMYVISANNGNVCVFDRVTRTFVRSIFVGGPGSTAIHAVVLPDGSALYVNNSSSGTVARVDLASNTVTPLSVPAAYKMDVTADGSKIYLTTSSGGFGYIKTSTNSFTPIPLTGVSFPFGVTVDDGAGRVYVTDREYNNGKVYVVDLGTDAEITGPGLPITDFYLDDPRAIAVIKPNSALSGESPTVTSLSAGVPAGFSETVGADVILDGGLPVFERGFVFAETANNVDPMPGGSGVTTVVVSGTIGPMSTTLLGLNPGTDYTFRAYAKNFQGIGIADPPGTFTTASVFCSGVFIDQTTLPNGTLNAAYPGTTLTATGDGPAPYSYALVSGALPTGLTLTGGTIAGTPTATGVYTFAISATVDATGCHSSEPPQYTVTIGTAVAAGDVVISEFRTRGPLGPTDEYVELANRTSADVVVASLDGSAGWSIGLPGQAIALIPNGTVIVRGGHFLATGSPFSLSSYGYPDPVNSGNASLGADLPDDAGVAVFMTADASNYSAATVLDAAGGAAETDPLFYEGTRLVNVVGPADPIAQTAWVRRGGLDGIPSDTGDNDRDFNFVATDAGLYGPAGDVKAVLGSPNPEDSKLNPTSPDEFPPVRDVLQAELPSSLADPGRGQDQSPNRVVGGGYVDYRRKLTNNTGQNIGSLAYKVLNLTTLNSRPTLGASRQAVLAVTDAPAVILEVPVGTNNFINVAASWLDSPGMYSIADPVSLIGGVLGGLNSRVIVPLGGFVLPDFVVPGGTIAVNIRASVLTNGYYLYVIIPEVSPKGYPMCTDCECFICGSFLEDGSRTPGAGRAAGPPGIRRKR